MNTTRLSGTRITRPTPHDRWLRLVEDAEKNLPVGERSEWLGRAMNVTLAGLVLIIVSPLMLVLAAAVKLTSRGPVFYAQTRVGIDRRWRRAHSPNHHRTHDLGGLPFAIYKFRTMHLDAEQHSGAVWATRGDPRVTVVGRFLRQYRLDELPQLINVLKGDMNLVGPRPERPSIFARLRVDIPEYALRQRSKPGITGLAQINHHYDSCVDHVRRKLQYDLAYLRRQGILEDFKILLKTLPVVLFRRSGW